MRASRLLGAACAATIGACGARTPLGVLSDGGLSDAHANLDAGASDARADAGAHDAGADAQACPFALDATVSGTALVTTDDEYVLYVNGTLIDATPHFWWLYRTYPLPIFRHPSRKNSIAIQGTNSQNTSGPDRGIVFDLRFTAGASQAQVVTDGTWKLSTSLIAGWSDPMFDASGWKGAFVEGPYGMAPWGSVFMTPSAARWLWSYDSNQPSGAKVVMETIWVRRDFYVDVLGNVRDVPTPCP